MSDISVSFKNKAARPGESPAYLTIGEPNALTVEITNTTGQEILLTTQSALAINFTSVQVDTGAIRSTGGWTLVPNQGSLYLIPAADRSLQPQHSVSVALTDVSTGKGYPGAYSLTAQPAGFQNVANDSLPVTLSLQSKEVAGDQPLSLSVNWQDGGPAITVPIGTAIVQNFTLDTGGVALPNDPHKTALFVYFDEGSGPGQMPGAHLSLRVSNPYGLDWQVAPQTDPRTGWKVWVDEPERTHFADVSCSAVDPHPLDGLPSEIVQLNRGQLSPSIMSAINGSQVTVSPKEDQANTWIVTEPEGTFELVYQPQLQKIVVWSDRQRLFRQAPNDKLVLELTLDIPEGTEPGVADLKIAWSDIPGYKAGSALLMVNKHAPFITKAEVVEPDGETPARRVIPQPQDPFTFVVDVTDGPVDVRFKFLATADALRSISGIYVGDRSDGTLAGRPTEMAFSITAEGITTGDGKPVHNLPEGSAASSHAGWQQLDIQAMQGSQSLETRTLRFICLRFLPPIGKGDGRTNNLKGFYLAGYDFTGGATANWKPRSLHGADLSHANLVGANLSGVDLGEANLSHADLAGAILEHSSLRLAKLHHARNFDEAVGLTDKDKMVWQLVTEGVKNVELRDIGYDLSGVDLSDTDLRDTYLGDVDLRGSDLRRADLRRASLHGTKIDDATKLDAKWLLIWQIVNGGADKAALAGKDLSESTLNSVDLTDADLRGANLSGAILTGVMLRGAVLDQADLRHAGLVMADLRGADLRGATLGWNDWDNSEVDGSTLLDEKWRTVHKLTKLGMYFSDRGGHLERADLDLAGRDLSACLLHQIDLRGAELHATNLSHSKLINCDLRGAILSAANLTGADLTSSKLGDASLAGADLTGADLSHADLRGCKIEGGDRYKYAYDEVRLDPKWRLVWEIVNGQREQNDLRNVDLSNADLRQANLRDADLRGANLSGALLDGVDLAGSRIDASTQIDAKWRLIWAIVNGQVTGDMLSGQDLRWIELEKADLTGVNLQGANMRSSKLRGAQADGANLTGAHLDGADLREAMLRKAILKGADLGNANLTGAHLAQADLTDTHMHRADLRSSDLTNAILTGVDLTDADLAGANMTGADLRGAKLPSSSFHLTLKNNPYDEQTQWPDGFDPKAHGGQFMGAAPKPEITSRPLERREMRRKLDSDSE